MAGKTIRNEAVRSRRKRLLEEFSNYENAVTLISSLQQWFEYRWGRDGKEHPGLLKHFSRFPEAGQLTPDFEARFHTPYVLWGDHKRTFPQKSSGHDSAVEQILKYASYNVEAASSSGRKRASRSRGSARGGIGPFRDVLVLVASENDDVAAEAIDVARAGWRKRSAEEKDESPELGQIVVLGCHRDHESINGEWYKLKWRNHHRNQRFRVPNISTEARIPDLNKLLVDSTHHVIPVNRPALGLAGWHPFINDEPPAIYTAIRLVIPAINQSLTNEERDHLQTLGWVEKDVTTASLESTELVSSLSPRPPGIGKWIQAGLRFLADEIRCAQRRSETAPAQFTVKIDSRLIRGEARELFSQRAAVRAGQLTGKRARVRGGKRDAPGQITMFES